MSDAMTSLCQAGITLSVAGDTLVARPRAAITDELRVLIRDHKGVLMVELAEQTAIVREAEDLRELFEERAGILEHDAGLSRAEAELEAARLAVAYARNRDYLWSSLRLALANYPVLLAQVPDRPGKVDGLPLGVATAYVRKDRRVLKQGEFTGAQEVRI